MQLQEHPSIMGRWPPNSGGMSATGRSAPANCQDTLMGAHYLMRPETGLPGIVLRTAFKHVQFVRELLIYDQEFAKAICKFLRGHKGETVKSIGELDVGPREFRSAPEAQATAEKGEVVRQIDRRHTVRFDTEIPANTRRLESPETEIIGQDLAALRRSDRRQTARFDMEIPVSIRPLDSPEMAARMAVSSNISSTGLCLATDLPAVVGMPVEVSLRMPQQVTGRPSQEWRCRGQVVRVQPRDVGHDKASVGVQFQYYEVRGGRARFEN